MDPVRILIHNIGAVTFHQHHPLRLITAKTVSYTHLDVYKRQVCQVAADEGKIRPEDIDRLKKFRANPSDESWIR